MDEDRALVVSSPEPRHVLTINPGIPGGYEWRCHILFQDGTETTVYADERERVIARASAAIETYHRFQNVGPEVLIMNQFGEIVREPVEHSMKVAP